jgi:hypothetical protein
MELRSFEMTGCVATDKNTPRTCPGCGRSGAWDAAHTRAAESAQADENEVFEVVSVLHRGFLNKPTDQYGGALRRQSMDGQNGSD